MASRLALYSLIRLAVISVSRRFPTELGLQQVELAPIRLDCALARLAGQVTVSRLR
jgi:hypothetical protein